MSGFPREDEVDRGFRPDVVLDLLESEVGLNGHTRGPSDGGINATTARRALRAGREAIQTLRALADSPTGLDTFTRHVSEALQIVDHVDQLPGGDGNIELLAMAQVKALTAIAIATAAVARRPA